LGITRERVRQIEEVGFNFVRKNHQPTLDMIFKEFEEYFAKKGGFKKKKKLFCGNWAEVIKIKLMCYFSLFWEASF
jgi:hypothetical protein